MASALFSLISRAYFSELLETLYKYINLPVRLIDMDGHELLSFGGSVRFCSLLQDNVFSSSACAALHRDAGKRAQTLGEAYIFACHAGLSHIAFPLINEGELLGSVLVGPFLMDKADSTPISGIMERHALSAPLALELYDELSGIVSVSPDRVTLLSKLVGYLFATILPSERSVLMHSREKLSQQSRINETVQLYKAQDLPASRNTLYEKESKLLTKARTGNLSETKALLNELLGYILFCEGGNQETIRLRAVELTTLFSRAAIEGGARPDSVYTLNDQYLSLLYNQQSFEEIALLLQEIVESFMGLMFNEKDKGNAYIRQALQFISLHYAQPMTVADTARELNLSPNYFATLFRETIGESFHSYLMRVRVEESKQLLLSTKDSLTDIAIAMGFTDQSYFCRVFKRYVGITPGKFRS